VQALVLAGGEGTRLRPLTLTLPKPVIPLAGRPFLSFMLDWLHRHGVDDVLLSCGYRSHDVERVLGDRHRGMRSRRSRLAPPVRCAWLRTRECWRT
jgi:mannose-1-phosphate guanylyltransferase